MLREETLFGFVDKVDIAVKRLKEFEPPEGYYVAFSGGKDSVCIMALIKMAGVKYEAHFHNTTVEAPELIKFVMKHHKGVIFDHPKYSMRQLIIKKGMPPTRMARYCCEYLKEGRERNWHNCTDRIVVTGIRWDESKKRSNRRMMESCLKKKGIKYLNPIIDWSDQDVWDFIHEYKVPYCELYDQGFKRIGCIGCPLSKNQEKELDRYPVYKKMYRDAFKIMLEVRKQKGRDVGTIKWKDLDSLWNWWLRKDEPLPESDFGEMFEGGDL